MASTPLVSGGLRDVEKPGSKRSTYRAGAVTQRPVDELPCGSGCSRRKRIRERVARIRREGDAVGRLSGRSAVTALALPARVHKFRHVVTSGQVSSEEGMTTLR
jgi:hypothetical protein